ncbi:hypothetical protein FQR65_LT03759 [Abscondita terminalis]|nr:hypothetical protein FQR65_LT03759 [Abscondita terminalis]
MWTRPESVPFPSIWRTFKGRREIDGVLPTFWIQDIPPEEYEDVVQCMITRFCGDEPLTKYSNFLSDPQSIQEMTALWREALKDKLGIICYMENPDKNGKPIFAGVNCTHKKLKTDEKYSTIAFTGKSVTTIMNLMDHLMKQKNAFEEINTDVLLSALGLYVFPQFRGQNIGLELLHARRIRIAPWLIEPIKFGYLQKIPKVIISCFILYNVAKYLNDNLDPMDFKKFPFRTWCLTIILDIQGKEEDLP